MDYTTYRGIAYKAINNDKRSAGYTGTMIIKNPENLETFGRFHIMRASGVRHAAYRFYIDFPQIDDIIAYFDAEWQGEIVESYCVTKDGKVWQYCAINHLTKEERRAFDQGARGLFAGTDEPWYYDSREYTPPARPPAICHQPWRLRYKKMQETREAC